MKLILKNESQPTNLSEVPKNRWYENATTGNKYFPMYSGFLVVYKNCTVDCFSWETNSGWNIQVTPYTETVTLIWGKE